MPKCAFLTIKRTEGWFIDDNLVHQPLKDLGWEIENVPWDSPVKWDDYDVVVIRSTWDYQHRLEEFKLVLKQIDQSSAILLNDIKTVLWNVDKSYLLELEKKNVEIVPSVISKNPTRNDVADAFRKFGAREIIIKPTVSANAYDTFRIPKSDIPESEWLAEKFDGRTCLIQPFMESILNEGEFSLMYLNGELAHTIIKSVKKGDYRVQEEHGGIVQLVEEPEKKLIKTGNNIMDVLDQIPFYARVDLVRTSQNTFALMELELIEPSMYLRYCKPSAKRFAALIEQRFKNVNNFD